MHRVQNQNFCFKCAHEKWPKTPETVSLPSADKHLTNTICVKVVMTFHSHSNPHCVDQSWCVWSWTSHFMHVLMHECCIFSNKQISWLPLDCIACLTQCRLLPWMRHHCGIQDIVIDFSPENKLSGPTLGAHGRCLHSPSFMVESPQQMHYLE